MKKGKVLFFIACMSGGGADRVASLLSNEFFKNGYEVEMVITSMKKSDMGHTDLIDEIPMSFLADSIKKKKITMQEVFSSLLCKPIEATGKQVPAGFASLSFEAQYKKEISLIRSKLLNNPDATAIAFLQPSIPMLMLAARGLPNRIIISERGNPQRLLQKRYGYNFMEKYYTRADSIVFQTPMALDSYPKVLRKKGVVISNPVKTDLPEPYKGNREKNIVTFCRISPEKCLWDLIDAFALLYKDHGDYCLKIIGDAKKENEKALLEQLHKQVKKLDIEKSVSFLPFSKTVHEEILRDAIYVNCSETEGLSNAMLEAMAIGLPSVCTDCPIGGASATINDDENGLLVPVGDVYALYKAIKRVIEEDGLSEKFSLGGVKIREELSLEKTAKKWMELF